jgi:hypothetical protein
MAKSKRSAALFEVIQSSRLPKRPNPLFSPQSWFSRFAKPRTQFAAQATPQIATSTPGESPGTTESAVDALPAPAVSHTAPRQPIPGVDLQLDPDHHQIMFKVSYNSAIVTGFTFLMAIGLAYAVGKKMNHGPIAATASPSSAELRQEPAHPDVLDVSNQSLAKQADTASHASDTAQLAALHTPTTAPSPFDSQRIIGRQYVVVQIYPDKKNADEAASLLSKSNIPCTVENGLTGWASKSWWCVVGTTGFDHIRGNADYERYEATINRVSDQFASNSKFKKFEPRAYRWKESTT